jgi:hypothetical protein
MAEISSYAAAPYDGISQAPPQVRLASACDAMQDCIPAIPGGVQKRPPFEWQARLRDALGNPIPVASGATFVDIPRGDPSLDLTLLIAPIGGVTRVFLFLTSSWAALPVTVTAAAQAYLNVNTPQPNRDLRTCTVEDTTFITNRTATVANGMGLASSRPFEALIWCKLSGYARTTLVTVNCPALGVAYTASFTTGSGSNSNDPQTVGTDRLAAALCEGHDPHPGNDTPNPNPLLGLTAYGFAVSRLGSLISISHPTQDFTLDIADDAGGTGVIPIKGSVQRFSDLPLVAVDGFTVRIAQEAAGGNSDYYVRFLASSSSNAGTWKEVIAPGVPVGLDPNTMPVGLRFVGGVWTLDILPWKQRNTGTPALAADPEFIGDKITAVGWWGGRLVLVSNGQANLSASDDPYNFYTSTLAVALDSDPISFLPPTDLKTFFRDVAIFDQRLVIFGNRGQAVVSSTGAVTAKEARIQSLAKSPYTDALPVQDVNHKVYFGADRSGYLTLFELAIDRLSGLALPDEMTSAVPKLIPSWVDRAASYQTDYVTIHGGSGRADLYVRVFRHAEQQRVQNGWCVWTCPPGWTLGAIYIKDSIAYYLLTDTDGYAHACTMELAPLRPDLGGTIRTYLDLRVSEAQCSKAYDAIENKTTFTLPIPVTAATKASIRTAAGGLPEGTRPVITARTSSTITLAGDHRDTLLYFGRPYPSSFVPTRFYKRGQDGNPERAGRLTIQRVRVDVAAFSYLRAEVSITGRDVASVAYEGHGRVDGAPLQDIGLLNFPVGGNNEQTSIRFVSDDIFGFSVTGWEWDGTWVPRAQRVT